MGLQIATGQAEKLATALERASAAAGGLLNKVNSVDAGSATKFGTGSALGTTVHGPQAALDLSNPATGQVGSGQAGAAKTWVVFDQSGNVLSAGSAGADAAAPASATRSDQGPSQFITGHSGQRAPFDPNADHRLGTPFDPNAARKHRAGWVPDGHGGVVWDDGYGVPAGPTFTGPGPTSEALPGGASTAPTQGDLQIVSKLDQIYQALISSNVGTLLRASH
jgi:hypothetical protein